MRRKKVLIQTDSSLAKTGFGRNCKALMMYLYKTGKYELVEYACGRVWSLDPEHQRKPWKSYGALPDLQAEFNAVAPNDQAKRLVAYGPHYLNRVVYQEKPDVYFAIQDIWGIDFAADRPWFNKITSVFWTTLDSLPILKTALDIAPKAPNFWVWSEFAEIAMKKVGLSHVKTVHGAIDASKFYRLPNQQKIALREFHGIPFDAFVIGFVFRNQPRKSVPNLLAGYKTFKQHNPHIKNPRLLLHTHWNEGWRIHDLAKEHQIPLQEIITTHVCEKCRSYKIQEYKQEHVPCPFCGNETGFVTTGPTMGVSEEQLNEIYNVMDVYCHPFTSGGQEIPVQEAKFAELITLVTNYSCGEEMCKPEAMSLPLDWQEYREPETQFIKATTSPNSIAKQLTKVAKMTPQEREKLGKKARAWALDNYSAEAIGKQIEAFIDAAPFTEFDFVEQKEVFNPNAPIDGALENEAWILQLYERILGRRTDKYDTGVRDWLNQLKRGAKRQDIESFFRRTAAEKLSAELKQNQLDSIKNASGKKLLYVMPASERDLFLSSALFKSIKEQYPDYRLYVATDFKFISVLDADPYVDEVIPYFAEMDNITFLEGAANHNGFFDIAFLPYLHTQRAVSYIHNGQTKIAYGKCIYY